MNDCLIALGSNLGDRRRTLDAAVERLRADPHLRVVAVSQWHATGPVGGPAGQGEFLNGALRLSTDLNAEQLLDKLISVEAALGRKRSQRWAARTIDLDILLFGQQVFSTPRLTVPHPGMSFRRFVLEPAVEVAADWLHPAIGKTLAQLLAHLNTAGDYLAIAGLSASSRRALAAGVQQRLGGLRIEDDEHAPARLFDPGGHRWQAAVKLLRGRAAKIASDIALPGEEAGSAGWIVSDFWLDQTLADAVLFSQSDCQRVVSAWRAEVDRVLTPKLLVVIDGWRDDPPGAAEPSGDGAKPIWTQAQLAAWQQAFDAQLAQTGPGPTVHVDAAKPGEALMEVLAAMQAAK